MSNNRKGISLLERLLFGFARLVAIICAIAAIVGIILCSMFLRGKFDKPTTISYEEIASILYPTQDVSGNKTSVVSNTSRSFRLPSNLEHYFTQNDKNRLNDSLQKLDNDAYCKDFLDNLSDIVGEAVLHDIEPAILLNKYAELKFQHFIQSETEKYAAVAAKGVAIGTILWLVLILLLVSFMLLLLAIERHLRIATAANLTQPPA